MKLEHSIFTYAGERGENEDSALIIERRGITAFLVADGLGGHGGGAAASKEAVNYIAELINDDSVLSEDLINECFTGAQERIMAIQQDQGCDGMKTTLTILLTDGCTAIWAHVGDSRLYHFRGRRIISRTVDHSIAQTLVSIGDISEVDLKTSPDRNHLTRVLGTEWDEPKHVLDKKGYRLRRKDIFLICTDGLWERMDEKQAAVMLRDDSLDETLKKLCTQAVELETEKRRDDITAIAVRVV